MRELGHQQSVATLAQGVLDQVAYFSSWPLAKNLRQPLLQPLLLELTVAVRFCSTICTQVMKVPAAVPAEEQD